MCLAGPLKFFGVLVTLASSLVWVSVPVPKNNPKAAPSENVERDLVTGPVTALSIEAISTYTPFTQFARAAYCNPKEIRTWTCDACRANPEFQPTLTGGNGANVPYFFVGYWSVQNAVVVSHQGTDPIGILGILTDLKISKVSLDTSLFPGAPSDAWVHQGFRDAHMATASVIFTEVKNLISSKGATSVITIGHSLGGALAVLNTLFFRLNLPPNIVVRGVTYATPRVGVPAFVDFFNLKVNDFTRINRGSDPVPIALPRRLGFSHVPGEIYIVAEDHWNSCSGNENTDPGCTINEVPFVNPFNMIDHLGPYQGVWIGFCRFTS